MMRHLLLPVCLLACCLPASAADEAPPRCTYMQISTLPVRLVGPWLEPAVEGTIDGTPATMLVDTGNYKMHITMTGAIRRGMKLHKTKRSVEGFAGLSDLFEVNLQDISIGSSRNSGNTVVDVIQSTTSAPVYDAVVGAPFLLQADLEVDLPAKRLRLFQPRNCDTEPLYLWDEATGMVPFVAGDDYESPNPHFTVTINGKPVDAVIDTGAPFSILKLRAARRIGIDVDGPDVKRAGSMGGVGTESVRVWKARVKSFAIGGETISDAELGINDSRISSSSELLLGRDFLRTHRVLFAMSQKKLYFAYLGGEPFSPKPSLEPWMLEEAENGNPDAQYALAARYRSGTGVARDEVLGRVWLDKAAANGEPHANIDRGTELVKAGKYPEAIEKLRKGLERLPTDRYGALWLYLARTHNGEAALAQTELRTSLQKLDNDIWPGPIAKFYLGDFSASRLLDSAGANKDLARTRTCEARRFMARWQAAQGDAKREEPLLPKADADCDQS